MQRSGGGAVLGEINGNSRRPLIAIRCASEQGATPITELADTLRALNELLPRVCKGVATDLQNQPTWFQKMVSQTEIDSIECKFQIHIPEPVRLFYAYPAYALFMQTHFQTDVFMEPHFTEEDPERPVITKSAYPPWIAIGESPDTGMLLMVQLDSPAPQVAWRYFDPSPDDYAFPNAFQDWLLTGASNILRHNRDFCTECAKASQTADA